MLTGLKDRDIGHGRRSPRRYQFDDPAALDDDATFCSIGENSQGIFDPDRPLLVHGVRHLR